MQAFPFASLMRKSATIALKMFQRTVGVGSLAEGEEVNDGVVHLQDGCTLPVHYCQARPPAHRVVGETAGEDYEGLPSKNTQEK